MRKKLIILAIVLLVLASYSAFWYWQGQRFKLSVTAILDDVATELHQVEMEFLYSELRVTGFPFAHQVYIHQPRFIGDTERFPYDIVSHIPIVAEMNLLGTRFGMQIPREIEVLYNAPDDVQPYQLLFYSQPFLEVTFSYQNNMKRLKAFWLDEEINNEAFYSEGASFERVSFTSDAISAMAVNTGEKLVTVKKLMFDYEAKRLSDQQVYGNLLWEIDRLQSEKLLNLAWSDKLPFGYLGSKGSVEFWLPETEEVLQEGFAGAALKAHEMVINNEHFNVNVKGDIALTLNKASSENPIKISLQGYEKAVEYAAAFYNHYFANGSSDAVNWSDKARIKRAIRKLASEVSQDEESLVLKISTMDESDDANDVLIYVGDYSLSEAKKLWKTGYGTLRKKKPVAVESSVKKNEEKPRIIPSQEIKSKSVEASVPSIERDAVAEEEVQEAQDQEEEQEEDWQEEQEEKAKREYVYPDTTNRRR